MGTAVDNYATLHYSPFVVAPMLESFFEAVTVQPNNILLAYLVLPLSLYPPSREFLRNAKSSSSLRTFCKDRNRLYGLPDRVHNDMRLTQFCLQLLIDYGSIVVEKDLSVRFVAQKLDASACPANGIKAAKNIGKLLGDLDVVSIYRFLGVKKI